MKNQMRPDVNIALTVSTSRLTVPNPHFPALVY